jgi:hypothetical protein
MSHHTIKIPAVEFTGVVETVCEPITYETGTKREIRVRCTSGVGDNREQTVPVELRGKFVDLRISEGMNVRLVCYMSGRQYVGRKDRRDHCHLSMRALEVHILAPLRITIPK